MCGIAGFNWNDERLIARMADRLRHRGPDQHGIHVEGEFSMGFQRLSIIDLSEHGRQPMTNGVCPHSRGDLWIAFNGEIYNYPDIRKDLEERGHRFKSQTDTEVILHSYEEDGDRCLQRFNGMFAIALWDARARRLLLARDRLGKKPIYYYWKNGKLLFASEIKAILEWPNVGFDIDEESLALFLGYEYIPAPRTILKDVHKLPAGHTLVYENGSIRVEPYWDLSFTRQERCSVEEYEEGLRERIDKAVKQRLRSDVPLGVFLSGGIDSSTVVAFMARHFPGRIRSFSLGYRDKSYSEFQYAKRVSEVFGTDHQELLIDPIGPDVIEKVVYHADEPFSEFSVLPFYMICQKAREHVTVCLSGEGGDEVFAGYDRFLASRADRLYRRIPSPIRLRLIHPLISRLGDQDEKKGLWNVMKRFMQGSELPASGEHMRWQYFLGAREASMLLKPELCRMASQSAFRPIEDLIAGREFPTALDRELFIELRFMMTENPLMKVDKMSMAHALEVRAPLLDYELVEYAARIPSSLKLDGRKTKAILKSALRGILPDDILSRKKHGYSFPIKHWLRGDMRAYMLELFQKKTILDEYINKQALGDLVREHDSGAHNHSHLLWALMNVAIWHRVFGKRQPSAQASLIA